MNNSLIQNYVLCNHPYHTEAQKILLLVEEMRYNSMQYLKPKVFILVKSLRGY